jgi:hypothetical protein
MPHGMGWCEARPGRVRVAGGCGVIHANSVPGQDERVRNDGCPDSSLIGGQSTRMGATLKTSSRLVTPSATFMAPPMRRGFRPF